MKITLTPQESEHFFYSSLCNADGTGYMAGYGLELICDPSQYKDAREHLHRTWPENAEICHEDVLMQILRDGGKLTYVDHEGGDDQSITLAEVHSRVGTVDPQVLLNMQNETDDAYDADAILQTVFWGEVIFG
jgi:hypothetical protein